MLISKIGLQSKIIATGQMRAVGARRSGDDTKRSSNSKNELECNVRAFLKIKKNQVLLTEVNSN